MPASSAAGSPMRGSGFVPAPPKLAYVNNQLRSSRSASAKSRPGTSGSATARGDAAGSPALALRKHRPGTATTRTRKTFLQDNEAAESVLPQPLPAGIPYVAAFTTFDDLIERKILSQSAQQVVRLVTEDVRILYDAKCEDQGLKPSWDREMRFLELVCACCRGQQFVLRENGLGARSAEAVARVLAHHESFTVLDMSGNRIKDEGAKALAGLLQTNDILVHLGLKSNDIGADGIVALCDALQSNCTLTSLDLGGIRGINRNHVGGRGAEALGNMLARNHVLHTLDISSNGLGLEGCGLVAAGLNHNFALRRLLLASNNIGADGCRLLASVLQDCLLEVVDLRRNEIGDVGAAHVAAAFKAGTPGGDNIVELLLEHNGIREAGCRALAPMVRKAQSLRKLHLSGNHLGPGLSVLFDGIRDNRKLQILTVMSTSMQVPEAEALARALKGGSSLVSVDLSRNRMDDEAGVAIFSALASNNALEAINVAGCSLGNKTAKALADALKTNKTLTSINARQNLFNGDRGDMILEELKGNPHVRSLDLSFNDIPYLAQLGINDALHRNSEAWKAGEGSRIAKEIEELDYAQRELFQVEEDIVSERRAVTERGEELTRRKDTHRGQQEINRRILRELEDRLAAARAVTAENEEKMRETAARLGAEQQQLEQKANSLLRKIDRERERAEGKNKEADKLRKQLKTLQDKQDQELAPLVEELEHAAQERDSDLRNAEWLADDIAKAEFRLLALERALHLAPDRHAAAAAAAAEGSAQPTPRKPGGKGAKK